MGCGAGAQAALAEGPESGSLEPESQRRAQVEGALRTEDTRRPGDRPWGDGRDMGDPQSGHIPGVLLLLLPLSGDPDRAGDALPMNG